MKIKRRRGEGAKHMMEGEIKEGEGITATYTANISRICQRGKNPPKIITVPARSTGNEVCTVNKYYKQCCEKTSPNRQLTLTY